MRSEENSRSGHRTIRVWTLVAGIMTISLATITVLFELEKAGLIELAEMQTRPHFQLTRPARQDDITPPGDTRAPLSAESQSGRGNVPRTGTGSGIRASAQSQ